MLEYIQVLYTNLEQILDFVFLFSENMDMYKYSLLEERFIEHF